MSDYHDQNESVYELMNLNLSFVSPVMTAADCVYTVVLMKI